MASSRVRGDERRSRASQSSSPVAGHERHAPERHAALARQRLPRGHVGVVVQLGDDDLVPGAPAAAEGAAEVEGERRHVGAEDDLGRAWRRGSRRAPRGRRRAPRRSPRWSGSASGCWRCGAGDSRPWRRRRPGAPGCRPDRRSTPRARPACRAPARESGPGWRTASRCRRREWVDRRCHGSSRSWDITLVRRS